MFEIQSIDSFVNSCSESVDMDEIDASSKPWEYYQEASHDPIPIYKGTRITKLFS
jgi:hypothetical protein